LIARSSVAFSTSSLASNAAESVTVTLFKSAFVYKIVTNRPAWVRAYATAAYRTADVGRVITDDIDRTNDHGLLFEFITATGELTWALSPGVELFNLDSTLATDIYFRIVNLDGSAGVVTTTLTVRQTE